MTTTGRLGRRPVIEVLYVQDCPHYRSEPVTEYLVGCRLYRLEHRFAGQPEELWVREALLRAVGRS
jgi:hypothetical protein